VTRTHRSAICPSVVCDLDRERVGPRSDADERARGIRVAQHVGQRFLNDPIGGAADRARDGRPLDRDLRVGAEAGGASVLDQSGQRPQIRRRRGRNGVVRLAQEPQGGAQIAQRRRGHLLDVTQCCRGVLRVAEIGGYARSDVDGHKRVSERVMELTSDPHPLVGQSAPMLLLALLRLLLRPLAGRRAERQARANGVAEHE
jgi:hypothetical protein